MTTSWLSFFRRSHMIFSKFILPYDFEDLWQSLWFLSGLTVSFSSASSSLYIFIAQKQRICSHVMFRFKVMWVIALLVLWQRFGYKRLRCYRRLTSSLQLQGVSWLVFSFFSLFPCSQQRFRLLCRKCRWSAEPSSEETMVRYLAQFLLFRIDISLRRYLIKYLHFQNYEMAL